MFQFQSFASYPVAVQHQGESGSAFLSGNSKNLSLSQEAVSASAFISCAPATEHLGVFCFIFSSVLTAGSPKINTGNKMSPQKS